MVVLHLKHHFRANKSADAQVEVQTELNNSQSRFLYFIKYGTGNIIIKGFNKSWGNKDRNEEMPLILENVLIRKRNDTLPEGASGYCVRLPSVFLLMLSDGAELRGTLKQGEEEREIRLFLERASYDDFLHIAAADWDATLTKGRASFNLIEAYQDGKRILLYEKRDVITSPAHSCRIKSKR